MMVLIKGRLKIMISTFPALSIPNAILFSPHSRQSSLDIWVIYASENALRTIFICSCGKFSPIMDLIKSRMGFIKIMIKENNINMPASLVGIKNSLRIFLIKIHSTANKIPIEQILKLSFKVQTHPLFHQKDYQFHLLKRKIPL